MREGHEPSRSGLPRASNRAEPMDRKGNDAGREVKSAMGPGAPEHRFECRKVNMLQCSKKLKRPLIFRHRNETKEPPICHASESLPIVLVPGLNCSARLYAEQVPALWRFGPVTVADHTRDNSMAAIARRILAAAPPRFALAGLSMGGYIALEIVRQAPQTGAETGADRYRGASGNRRADRAPAGPDGDGACRKVDRSRRRVFVFFVHPSRHGDVALRDTVRAMAEETGVEAFLRQQQAIMRRPDSRPDSPPFDVRH